MQDGENNWMNIADIMSALMMIFMFISIAFLYQILNEREVYKVSLNKALHEEFDKDLDRWQAIITDDNIMRFNSPFEAGSKELPSEFSQILANYFPRYIKVLTDKKFKDEIDEIRVEGHTSNGWGSLADTKKIYLNNMNLSQGRASNVLELCYELNNTIVEDNRDWLQHNLRANGMASSKLLYQNNSMDQDRARSRRVEFMVATKENLNEER